MKLISILAVCLLLQGCGHAQEQKFICSEGFETPWVSYTAYDDGSIYWATHHYYKVKQGETCTKKYREKK